MFSDKNSQETRAPIAFIMDRDRRVGGIKGVGANNAREILSKMKKRKGSNQRLVGQMCHSKIRHMCLNRISMCADHYVRTCNIIQTKRASTQEI